MGKKSFGFLRSSKKGKGSVGKDTRFSCLSAGEIDLDLDEDVVLRGGRCSIRFSISYSNCFGFQNNDEEKNPFYQSGVIDLDAQTWSAIFFSN